MNSGPISIKTGIVRGIRTVKAPARWILRATTVLVLLIWIFIDFTWWPLLLIPLGLLIAIINANRARARWRLWAYSNVTDIHQLQRSAELAQLLPIRSHEDVGGWLSFSQRKEMTELLRRFSHDPGFVDDPEMPAKTDVCEQALLSSGQPVMTIDNSGIHVHGEGSFGWEEIMDDRIASVGYLRKHPLFRTDIPGGMARVFRFDCGSKQFEFKMEDIKMSAWELDLLTYIYRGRWAARR